MDRYILQLHTLSDKSEYTYIRMYAEGVIISLASNPCDKLSTGTIVGSHNKHRLIWTDIIQLTPRGSLCECVLGVCVGGMPPFPLDFTDMHSYAHDMCIF